MKLVIQDGTCIKREDLATAYNKLSLSQQRLVGTIVVYLSLQPELQITYNPKEQLLGIHIMAHGFTASEVLLEMGVAIFAVSELGVIPKKLSKSRRNDYVAKWEALHG